MFEAVTLDFYGTVVHEDNVLIDEICRTVSASVSARTDPALAQSTPPTPKTIGSFWGKAFSTACTRSHGDSFETQRSIERWALAHTIDHFGADCHPDALSERLFEHWRHPPIFADARAFLESVRERGVKLPIVVLSNIDRQDIEAAIELHSLSFDAVVTSEDVRSYKPRPELFRAGLAALDLPPSRVLHVGDSFTSDVAGAAALSIPVAWVNRTGKARPPNITPDSITPDSITPDYEVSDLEQLRSLFAATEPG